MKRIISYLSIITIVILISSCLTSINKEGNKQINAASGVIGRVLPEYADHFVLKLIEKERDNDVFEIETRNKKIIISGSSGVAMCSGFNYYLKNYCNAVYNFRTGENLNIKELPLDFETIKKVTPYSYRYMFNYCTFSYSMPFWDWEQWENLIDWMALNGINMPLAPMGQELIWQRVYKKYGLSEEDLKDFFPGPAYNAFGRMGCIDGYGGPLPQSWIENENILQKKILKRERQLGMTPVLQGFTGHVPPAFARKNQDIKITNLKWANFPKTYLLDWEEPLFTEISKEFISELTKEYGTDNLYAIDQFIEMNPEIGDTSYLKNMSKTVMASVTEADPKGKWVLQTWPFNYQRDFWTPERTKAYFDGVPDDRLIALELAGERWDLTGWYKHESWHGKPWVWSVLSNFGDRVEMFGGLPQIVENFEKVLSSPEKGNLAGLGLMNEGLGYNPVVYELVVDMVWETGVPDLGTWKEKYLKSRYGIVNEDIINSWEHIFDFFYTKKWYYQRNKIISRPYLAEKDIWPSKTTVLGAESLIGMENKLKDIDAFQFDIVHLFRDILGQYTGHLVYEITSSYQVKNIEKFNEAVKEFNDLSEDLEQLIATREEFLFGKWIADSKERATNADEERLYEWNAKAIVTNWGGEYNNRGLNGYAKKDWAGLYSSYYLPRWNKLFDLMKSEITGGEKLDMDKFNKDITIWEDNWNNLREENIISVPSGNSIELAKELWEKYGEKLLNHYRQ